MTGRLEGKVALITGTGGGQGRSAALRFAVDGAIVVGTDVKVEGNAETQQLVTDAGGTMYGTAPVDLGDPEQAREWVEGAVATHGRIDVLYNNASAGRRGAPDEMSIDDWDFTVRNELDIVFYVTKYAWPHLKVRGGVVINTASVAGHVGTAGGGAHAATKAAVLGLTRAWAVDGAPYGIRVVSISPGPIETPGTAAGFAVPGVREGMENSLLAPRLGLPDDIAQLAVYLASDAAEFLTGSDYLVDGGLTAWRSVGPPWWKQDQ